MIDKIKELEKRVKVLEDSQSVFSIRKAENVSYSRRHGQGFVILGYSVLIRVFGRELKGIKINFPK